MGARQSALPMVNTVVLGRGRNGIVGVVAGRGARRQLVPVAAPYEVTVLRLGTRISTSANTVCNPVFQNPKIISSILNT